MEKIFVRSKELERALDFEKNSCRTKKETTAFQKYVRSLERTEYQKAAQPYIVESSEKYIRTLISLVKKLSGGQSALSRAEEERLFQALALFCVRPKLIFDKVPSNNRTSDYLKLNTDKNSAEHHVKKFEKELGRFNRKWNSFVAEIRLCEKYMFRGTRDLDRNRNPDPDESLNNRLSPEEGSQLKKELNDIYRAYYYELQAAGLHLLRAPSVDDGLLFGCVEKQWLLPLSHVILIRDAQCQMMDRVKYKKEALFFGGKGVIELDLTNLSEKQKYRCGTLTYAYALEIRTALAKALDRTLKSDCKNAFAHFYREEYQRSKKENKEIGKAPQLSGLQGCLDFFASQRFKEQMDELEKLDISPFSVPDCHIETLALRIAAKLELNAEQLQIVIKELPRLFWDNVSLEKWLEQLNIFEENTARSLNDKLRKLLLPICKLLSPNGYYSAKKTEDELSQELLRAAKVLDPQLGGKDNPDPMRKLWNVFSDIIYFRDLTCPALLLSGAVDTEYCPEVIQPKLISYYTENLDCSLEKYQKSSYKRQVLGLERLTSEGKIQLTQLQKNPDRSEQKRLIVKQLIGTETIEELTLDMADEFWSRPEFSLEKGGTNVAGKLISATVGGASTPGKAQGLRMLSPEEKKYMCLIVYKQLIDYSISLIQREATKVLLILNFNK